jgi:hypothetical protein
LLYKKWVGISVLAGCMRRKCVMQWGTIPFYPNMYIVLVGPSGKCRKGTAMSQGYDFLKEMNIKMAAESTTREALIQALQQSNDTQVDPVTNKMYLHASLTIYSQELTVFLGYNNSQLMSDLTDWYDCRSTWTYRTKHQGTDEIIGVYVNLIGATTPELLQTALPRDAIGGGLTSRMIFVYEMRKSKTVVAPFQTKEEKELKELLMRDLDRICMLQGEFKATEEFIETWSQWYTAYDQGPPPFDDYRFAGYFERRPNHLMKLSCIMSAARTDSMVVDKCDFDKALDLLVETERRMPLTFSGVGKFQHSEMMERIMAAIHNAGETTIADLLWLFRADLSGWDLDKIIQSLEQMGQIQTAHTGSSTRVRATDKLRKERSIYGTGR